MKSLYDQAGLEGVLRDQGRAYEPDGEARGACCVVQTLPSPTRIVYASEGDTTCHHEATMHGHALHVTGPLEWLAWVVTQWCEARGFFVALELSASTANGERRARWRLHE